MQAIVEEHLHALFFNHPEIQKFLPLVQRAVLDGKMPPTVGAQTLLQKFEEETGHRSKEAREQRGRGEA
jgi:hypothetical protein